MIKNIKKYMNKKMVIVGIAALVIGSSATYMMGSTYAIKIDNEIVGFVKDKEEAGKLIDSIYQSYEEELRKPVKLNREITYDKIFKLNKQIASIDTLQNDIEKNVKVMVEGYSLKVNGSDLVIVDSRDEAEKILDNIRNMYLEKVEDVDIKDVSFIENVEIEKKDVDPDDIQGVDEALKYITIGTDEIKKYEVQSGDTTSHIAVRHNIGIKEIKKANPDIDINRLQIGQEVNLTVPKPFISVKIVKNTNYEERIPYQVEYEETNSLYKGDRKTKIKGEEGKKEVNAEIVIINGIEEEKNIIQEKIIEEPKGKVVLLGTKERPKTLAYGVFNSPTRGVLTSEYGPRWGRSHSGIDLANPTGTPIKASDGGKVIYSGWKGNYGYLVIIDHENGYKTYYGHCSKLLVKVGERVYRGETIAKVGNTGNSTGPHLHFEVRKNGVAVNPYNYLK